MTLEDSIHSQRLRVLREAERLGNVSEACRRHGLSRTLFYRLRQRVRAVRRRRRPSQAPAGGGRAARRPIPVQTERRVIALALAWPTCGPQWYSDQLAREGVTIAADHDLAPVAPPAARDAPRAPGGAGAGERDPGLLTERTVKPARHVAAQAPGDLLSLDTFYVGKLKGVGKVWQITGCDVASSFAWARLVLGEVTAAAVLAFLRDVVRPGYRRAGWRLKRVLTDNGKEFKGVFAAGCDRPQHPRDPHEAASRVDQWVRRALQKTILHEHWRVAFRRQYFTGRRALATLARSVSAVLQLRAHASRLSSQRPHTSHGLYRRGGRMTSWVKVSTPLRNWTP